MNRDEKYLVKAFFEVKAKLAEGKEFEDFFCSVMEQKDSRFDRVKPQGAKGDRKNDGFIKDEGIYFQVYAPESPQHKWKNAINKLRESVKGLKSYWDKLYPIKNFFFVFNDKGKGTFIGLEEAMVELRKQYSEISFAVYRYLDLERDFFSLTDDQIRDVLGPLPDPEKIEIIDFQPLSLIIKHLMALPAMISSAEIGEPPDFDDKIKFNNLGRYPAENLRVGSYQHGEIEAYFKNNSDFVRQDIAHKMNQLYLEGKALFEDRTDHIFFYILSRMVPDGNRHVYREAIVLMAYYFESCDVFEEPPQ